MGKMKQIQQLESDIFDIIQKLNETLKLKKKEHYKLCLVAMDSLNEDYNNLTGNYYIHPLKALGYYEHLWSKF